jgi:16S rRNA (guanine966-N2)-methyltransferase
VKQVLRLTGGSFTGKKLYVPGTGVRPATNLVREAIFATLPSFFEGGVRGLTVLDLFAGAGSLGFEAMSRGASAVTFVDRNRASLAAIRKNLELLNYEAQVVGSDALLYLRRNRGLRFDLVFMDPPYRYKRSGEVVKHLTKAIATNTQTLLVHERYYEKDLPDWGAPLDVLRRRRYGQTEILYVKLRC